MHIDEEEIEVNAQISVQITGPIWPSFHKLVGACYFVSHSFMPFFACLAFSEE
jgi:hypothetical protein